jgi:mRNA-degrading endonuclease toxin of MazEF toxin-antitoxin module
MVDLGLAQKVRPAVVLNRNFTVSDRALITVVPQITTLRSSQFEVSVGVPFLNAGAFSTS